MTTLEALLLGMIQGLTEFFPISSSGHLQLGQTLLGWKHLENYILFDLICHLGTLMAIFCLLSQQIQDTLSDKVKLKQIALATLPLFPLLLFLKPIKSYYGHNETLGVCFLISAAILFLGERWGKVAKSPSRWLSPLLIGCSQAMAILPGISRSGSTISSARLMGWSPSQAATFSFLLAIPTILGGVIVECWQIITSPAPLPSVGVTPYIVGFLSSFIVGYMALQLVLRLVREHKMGRFALYCLMIGLLTVWYFHE